MRSLLFFCILTSAIGYAQEATLQWRSLRHNFGDVAEEGGPVRARFSFVNKGKTPIHVNSASASCGCTSPSYSHEAVAPGDSGFVEAQFSPQGKPGPFTKSITVRTDGVPEVSDLTITGVVTPRTLTEMEKYPDTLGLGLRVISKYLNMGNVSPIEGVAVQHFLLHNGGKQAANIKKGKVPAWMKVTIEPPTIAPSANARLTIRYDGPARKRFGPVTDPLPLVAEASDRKLTLPLEVTAVLDIPTNPPATPELAAKGPRAAFSKTVQDFGMVGGNRIHTLTVRIRNTGQAALTIYGVQPENEQVRYELVSSKIAAGDSTRLILHLDGAKRYGKQRHTVYVYTSDPARPSTPITLSLDLIPPRGYKPPTEAAE